MSAAQPPSAPSDGPPVGNSDLAAGVGAVGSGTQGRQVGVDNVVVEEVDEEHTFDEEPDYTRIGASRSHLESEWALDEGDDMPDPGSTGRWIPVKDFGGVAVNSAKRRQWKLCEEELRQVKAQCIKVFNTENPTRYHIVEYFFGGMSLLWHVFRDRLGWTHKKFLLFMATNQRMSAGRCSAAELYDPTTLIDTSGILDQEEYTACWDEICKVGKPSTTSSGANAEELFWEEVETALNKMLRRVTIVGRDGRQIYLFDDDKVHYESTSRSHREWNVKTMKHQRDNRWGFVLDTLCMPALLMPCNVYTHRRGDKQIDASRQQLYGSAFGNNPMRAPDLSGMELHFDRGFSGEKAHSDLYSPTNADSTCTTQRADWAAHNFGQTPKENDKRHYIDPKGIMALYLSEKTINNRKMASGALATGTDNVVLFMSTVHRSLKFDYVTSDRMGDLYTNDRPKLKELGFSLEQTACSSIKSAVAKSIHTEYYKLFQDTPVDQVTAFAGGKEFHLGRKFSLSSKQIYELILVLKKRFKDLDLDYIQEVFNFMYCNYSLEERQAEKDRAEAAAEAVDNEAAEDPITYQSTRTIQELMEADADDRTVEEKVRLHIHMCHENLFDASEQDLLAIVMDATTPYLDEFLRQIRGGTASALSAKKNRCKKWIEAPADRRKYVLMKKDKLQEEYTRKHGKPFAASWTPATLIKEILKEAAPEEPSSFEQDVMNAIVGNSVLTKMSDDANESCTKGHEMEPVFAAELMKRAKDGQFPFGTLEEISTVGTVQKTGERHVKTSVDRLLGVKTGDGEESQRELHLLELKARVKAATIQKEQDRVEKLRRKRLLNEDAIFLEMNSDHRHSHLGIASPGERLQALHHAYTYSKTSCIHAVGDTKNIFTVCKMNFSPTLLASYERTIKFIYDSGLNIFYRDEGDEDIQASDEEMARIKKAVKKHKKTYIEYYRFLQAYQVWRELTDCETKLPLPPLKNLLALALSWWNINKPSGDMITQMLWSMMYYSPVSNPQAVLVKRLAHQLPTYMCHRLFQLFNTTRDPSTFKSIYQYRDHTRKKTSLWKSTREIDSILISMANAYNPEPPLPPPPAAAANLAVAGTYTMHGAFQATGQSPLRSRRQWYINSANANLQAFQRRHACLGCSVGIACDQFGRAIAGGNCAQCGGSGATWWCTQCRVFLHGGAPKTSNGEPPLLMAAASHLPPDGRKRTAEGQFVDFFTRMSCSDKWHHCARERAYSGTTATSITTVSTAEFNPSQHNVNSNLSFDDATINTSEEEDATATTSTTIGNNNSNNNNGNNS